MKKFLVALMLCFVSIMSFGQLKQTHNPLECVSKGHPICCVNDLYCYSTDSTYFLVVGSNNQFESKCAWIRLGTKTEAVLLLEDLITTIKLSNRKNTYFVNGYEFTGDGWLLHTGELKYAAGSYIIYPMYLKKFVKKLKK